MPQPPPSNDPTLLHGPPGSQRQAQPPPSSDPTVLQGPPAARPQPPPSTTRPGGAPAPLDRTVLQQPAPSGRGSYAPPAAPGSYAPPAAPGSWAPVAPGSYRPQPPPSDDRTALQPPPAAGPAPSDDPTTLNAPPGPPVGNGAGAGVVRSSPTTATGLDDFEAAPGSFIGGYEVVRTLGRGGMGVVYLARDPRLERRVALKVLPITAGTQETAVARFQREARAIATLDHPNIRPIFGWGRDDVARVFWLAMGFVDGRPYDDVVKEAGLGHESARRAARVVADAARALAYAHQRGVVHRDVKPSNLMLEGAKVHVVDFGLARLDGSAELTVEGQVMGTLRFMPPEQALGAEASALSDVYSLGATLFWALTGDGPYEAQRIENLQMKMARGDPARRPTALRPDVPRDLEAVVCKALELEPKDRYGGADALADDLERFLAGEPVLARPPSAWRALRRALRRRALLVVPAALLVGAGLTLWQAWLVPRRNADRRLSELAAQPWDELDLPALLARRVELLRADPGRDASQVGVAARAAGLEQVAARAAALLDAARDELQGGVRAWVEDDPPMRTAPLALAGVAGRARAAAAAALAQEPELASLPEDVLARARALGALADEVAALARPEGTLRRTLPAGLALAAPDAPARPLPAGEVDLPAWGALVHAAPGHARSARVYGPRDLLDGAPAPRALKDRGRWAGMVRVEAPGARPFMIDRHEVSREQFAAFVRDGWDRDACWTAEGRAWRDRQAGRREALLRDLQEGPLPVTGVSLHEARAYAAARGLRLPTAQEWRAAAGVAPWRTAPSPERGRGAVRPAAGEPWDTSPCDVANLAGNVAEWVEDPALAPPVLGGGAQDVGLSLDPRRDLPRGLEPHRAVGFRCAADSPDPQGGAP